MIFEQYKYPFTQVDDNNCISFEKPENAIEKRRYRQIGIEHPHSIPIFKFYEKDNFEPEINHDEDWEPAIVVKIDTMTESEAIKEKDVNADKNNVIHNFPYNPNYHDFAMFDKDIYEINLYRNESKIIIYLPKEEQNNPYLIINAAYEIAD